MSGSRRGWGVDLVGGLGVVSWVAGAIGLAVAGWSPGGPAVGLVGGVMAVSLGVFSCALVAGAVAAAVVWRARRVPLVCLGSGVALWGAGSVVLTVSGAPAGLAFPSPGEWLFLAAYLGLAGYLFTDGGGAAGVSMNVWLEVVVTCGGAACAAGFVVVSPIAAALGRHGLPLLVALLYPILDLALIMLVVGQVMLGQRRARVRTVLTGAGLGLLTAADASSAGRFAAGSYGYGWVQAAAWTLAFLLLVTGACSGIARRQAQQPVQGHGPGAGARNVLVVMAAAGLAVVCLAYQPPAAVRPFIVVPAVVTLFAAGIRMVNALRQAHGATEGYRLARTDHLTGLPNRRALEAWIAEELAAATPLALLLLDVDGLKEINDSLGHLAGDALLQTVATRLSGALGGHPAVARVGGDQFALLIRDDDPERLLETALGLRHTVRKPSRVDGLDLSIEASVGVAVRTGACGTAPNPGIDLLRQADVAMYQAKAEGAGALLYDPACDQHTRERLQIAEQLRAGITGGQLEMWYQPQVDALTRRACSVEALIRWRHPSQGLLLPGTFLPAARRAHLMATLTEAVLDLIIADARRWSLQGLDLRVAVNLAPAELLADAVMDGLFTRYHAAGLTAGALVIEVTEDSFLADPTRARHVIHTVREHGLEVSIDDYGTGFSSLSYLRDLPLHELKIDQSFIADLLTDRRSRAIITTTNQLAHELGLRTVAEGVEDEPTAAALADLGVDLLQGYHFARPLPAHRIPAWLATQRTPAALLPRPRAR